METTKLFKSPHSISGVKSIATNCDTSEVRATCVMQFGQTRSEPFNTTMELCVFVQRWQVWYCMVTPDSSQLIGRETYLCYDVHSSIHIERQVSHEHNRIARSSGQNRLRRTTEQFHKTEGQHPIRNAVQGGIGREYGKCRWRLSHYPFAPSFRITSRRENSLTYAALAAAKASAASMARLLISSPSRWAVDMAFAITSVTSVVMSLLPLLRGDRLVVLGIFWGGWACSAPYATP